MLTGFPFGDESSFHSHRRRRKENRVRNGRIRATRPCRDAALEAVHGVAGRAGAPRLRTAAATTVRHVEHPTTPPTPQEAREQRVSAAPGLCVSGGLSEGVARQALLVLLKLLQRNGGFMVIAHERCPRIHGSPAAVHLAHGALDDRRLSLRPALRIGACVEGILQDRDHAAIDGRAPRGWRACRPSVAAPAKPV